MELYRSCAGGLCGGRSPAAGCRRPKDGAGQRPGEAGLEFLALARCVGLCGWKRSKPKAQPQGGGERWNCWSLFLWLCVLDCAVGRGQRNKPNNRGTAGTKIPKIPKIPFVVYILGSQTTPVILHGSRYATKHKKKSYIYTLLLMIVNILCLQM